ncbi:MAG: hypothetical protein ABL903_13250 [Methylococcales bacterium]
MLVYYRGWGYWECDGEVLGEENGIPYPIGGGRGKVNEVSGLFKLLDDDAMEIQYSGEAIVKYLFQSPYRGVKIQELNGNCYSEPYFVLCGEKTEEERERDKKLGRDEWLTERSKRYTRDEVVERPVEEITPTELKEITPTELKETERNTMLKLIIGMAIDAYGYDPNNNRNTATGGNKGSIKAGLEKVGLSADEKTIKKYLDDAAKQFPEAKPRKP